jgi:hypothetical protein
MKTNNSAIVISAIFVMMLGLIAYQPMLYASTSSDEDTSSSSSSTDESTTSTTTPPAPATTFSSTIVPEPTSSGVADFVRARVMLFGIEPNASNVVAWVNVPAKQATSADTITASELDASNNVTGDGIGEMFINLRNVSAAPNQQVQACALEVNSQQIHCDDAFQTSTNASTTLQILVGNPSATGAAAAAATGGATQ